MIHLPADITLHWLDLVAAVLLFLSILFGFFRGFTRELLALITWLAAAVLTHYAYDTTSGWISENVTSNSLVVAVLAVAVVFLALVILFSILASPLWRAVRRSDFYLIDRLLGLFVGLVRGLLLLLILWVGVANFTQADTKRQWARDSQFLAQVDDNARALLLWVRALPHSMLQRDWVQEGLLQIERSMGDPLTPRASDQPLNLPLTAPSTTLPGLTLPTLDPSIGQPIPGSGN